MEEIRLRGFGKEKDENDIYASLELKQFVLSYITSHVTLNIIIFELNNNDTK